MVDDKASSTEGPEEQGLPVRARTMADLARLAGVTAGTVSRALAGSSLISAKTRDHIQALAREHDFRLNEMARKLRTQRTGVIGIVVPLGHERRQYISDPFFMMMFGHLADLLTETGHELMLSRVTPDAPDWLDHIVDSGMLDGVLVIGESDQLDTIERTARRYRPLVVWGVHREGQLYCSVGTDNRKGGFLAAEHLIQRGARHLAFLGDAAGPEVAARFEGCVAAAAAAGLPADVKLLKTHLAREEMERDIAAHFRKLKGEIDGIVAASDLIAMTALRCLADHGVAVPGTMRVIGYDDLPLAAQTVPRLSTIRQDIASGAAAMVDALSRRLAGEASPSVILDPTLVARDTS